MRGAPHGGQTTGERHTRLLRADVRDTDDGSASNGDCDQPDTAARDRASYPIGPDGLRRGRGLAAAVSAAGGFGMIGVGMPIPTGWSEFLPLARAVSAVASSPGRSRSGPLPWTWLSSISQRRLCCRSAMRPRFCRRSSARECWPCVRSRAWHRPADAPGRRGHHCGPRHRSRRAWRRAFDPTARAGGRRSGGGCRPPRVRGGGRRHHRWTRAGGGAHARCGWRGDGHALLRGVRIPCLTWARRG